MEKKQYLNIETDLNDLLIQIDSEKLKKVLEKRGFVVYHHDIDKETDKLIKEAVAEFINSDERNEEIEKYIKK